MYCSSCGSKLSREAVFCHKCGKKIPAELLEEAAKGSSDGICEEDYDSLFTYSTDVPEKDYEAAVPENKEIKDKLFGLSKLIKNDREDEEIKGELNFDIPEDWEITEPLIQTTKKPEEPLPAYGIDLDIPEDWDVPTLKNAPKATPAEDEFSESDLDFDIPADLDEPGKKSSDEQEYSESDLDFYIPDDYKS